MHFVSREEKNLSRESHYLYGKLTLKAIFLSFAGHGDGPSGLGTVRIKEGRSGAETAPPTLSVRLKGVRHR